MFEFRYILFFFTLELAVRSNNGQGYRTEEVAVIYILKAISLETICT